MAIDWAEADALCELLTPEQELFARHTISQLADKWTLWTMAVLDEAGAPIRFSRVLEQVKGVSQKSLTKTLRLLEQAGLVERTIFAEVPPRVEYALTDLARQTLGEIYPLWYCTITNIGRLADARRPPAKQR